MYFPSKLQFKCLIHVLYEILIQYVDAARLCFYCPQGNLMMNNNGECIFNGEELILTLFTDLYLTQDC